MRYVDYAYYTNTYYGTSISKEEFPRFAMLASRYLDYYTRGKAAKYPCSDALKMACCALAEQYQAIETAQRLALKSYAYSVDNLGAEVSSETVGSWSRSYRSGGESASAAAASVETYKAALPDIVRQYLSGTDLLYRGGRCGSCSCSPTP